MSPLIIAGTISPAGAEQSAASANPASTPKETQAPSHADTTECATLNAEYASAQTVVDSEVSTYADLLTELAHMGGKAACSK